MNDGRDKEMRKRKKSAASSSSSNPLSSARKDVGGLWHRKSGAGYHLFLSYYGSQPTGVATVSSDDDGKQSSTATMAQSGVKAFGNSRAAKKRRRKKNDNISSIDANVISSNANTPHTRDETLTSHQDVDTSHPLIQAFNSQSNKYSHMASFVHALSRPLPLTLRLRKHISVDSSKFAQTIAQFSNFIAPVAFDPTRQIYQTIIGSNLCKFNLGHLSPQLKDIVMNASMNGTLARQEFGSMLPVLSLEAIGAMKRGSKVLDMCASPGSKTLQAVEIVVDVTSEKKKGRVIANDVSSGRLDALREAVIRSGVPTELTNRITYTNYDAQNFPPPKSGKLFDAIICDVPCSGDGTIRKDPHILPIWGPSTGNSLHGLQLKILLRALELVKVGGVVCYSTCSVNPIENEAVVSAALREMNKDSNAYQLVDLPASTLPGFIRRRGVDSWKVAFYNENNLEKDDDDFGKLSFYESYDDALTAEVREASASFWPDLAIKERSLHRCTRLLPQDHDSGGFFFALIKRL